MEKFAKDVIKLVCNYNICYIEFRATQDSFNQFNNILKIIINKIKILNFNFLNIIIMNA